MSTWVRRLVVVALLAGAAVALKLTVFRPDPVPVTTWSVAPGRVEETVTNSKAGTIKTRRRAGLAAEIGGRVVELGARKGERVREGQVLLRLADEEYRAQLALQDRSLESARARAREACATAEQAERDLARSAELARDEVIAEQALEQARWKVDSSRAACEAAQAAVHQAAAAAEVARATAAKTVVRAPFDGVVAELRTELGEWITPSPPAMRVPPVIDLIDDASSYVSAPLDEVDVSRVDEGLPVRVTLDPYPDQSFAGTVTRVAPYVEDVQDQNRTFEIEVELDDSAFARTLRPGTTADVEVILDAKDGALRVPSYALLEGGKVLVVKDGVLEEVDVETGLRNWEYVEILDGLSAGAAVVTSLDRAEVKAGARVVATDGTPR
jgi:HlyD family secretion protein